MQSKVSQHKDLVGCYILGPKVTSENKIHEYTWVTSAGWSQLFNIYTRKPWEFQQMLMLRHWRNFPWIPGSAFIKPDQLDPWIKDQIKITLLPTILHLQLPNFVSCGRACPSHMTQNLVTVSTILWTAERFPVDPWSMDYADPVW